MLYRLLTLISILNGANALSLAAPNAHGLTVKPRCAVGMQELTPFQRRKAAQLRAREEAAAKRAEFEALVEAERAAKLAAAEEYAAQGFSVVLKKDEPEPVPEPQAVAVEQKQLGDSSAKPISVGGETPARIFERVMAPIYMPPAVQKARPDLVEKYVKGKAKAAEPTPAPAPPSPSPIAMPAALKGLVRPTKKPTAEEPAAKPATKRAAKRAATTEMDDSPKAETPARIFERVMAPIYMPPAVQKARPDLVEKYGKKRK